MGDALGVLERLYSCQCQAVSEGTILERDKTFVDAKIMDGASIFLVGLISSVAAVSFGTFKYFKRFKDFKTSGSWVTGEDKWDALIITPSKNVRVFGIGVFESHPNSAPFVLGYKYILEDL